MKDNNEILNLLNSAVDADGVAMKALASVRVPCNAALRDHPTIQVMEETLTDPPSISVLGLLCAIGELQGGNKIAASFDDKTKSLNYFCELEKE